MYKLWLSQHLVNIRRLNLAEYAQNKVESQKRYLFAFCDDSTLFKLFLVLFYRPDYRNFLKINLQTNGGLNTRTCTFVYMYVCTCSCCEFQTSVEVPHTRVDAHIHACRFTYLLENMFVHVQCK